MSGGFVTVVVFALAFGALLGLWWGIPALSGLPWVPTSPDRIRRALKLAGLRSGEVLYDLGAGDGRVLNIAVREFGARAVGVEISPIHCILARLKIALAGSAKRASVIRGDFLRVDVSAADVVFAYLLRTHAARLRPRLEGQLRAGARVAAVSADFEGWEPVAFDEDALIFLYRFPPAQGSVESFLAREVREPRSEPRLPSA